MTLLSISSLQRHPNDIAVSTDDKLHVATYDGVHIYTTDGTYTGQSYLDGQWCESVTCTSNGYAVSVDINSRNVHIAILSHDLTCISYVHLYTYSLCDVVRYSSVDNSLAVTKHNRVIQLPQELYQPPFSLFSLCVRTILPLANDLPTFLLPPTLYKLVNHSVNHTI